MVIGIIGESCTGKSTLAGMLKDQLNAQIFSGKDYLRLAKNEAIAKECFQKRLSAALDGEHIIYVIAEKEHLQLLPEGAVRILMTADMDIILERFSQRMRGTLPLPVREMLERKHGMFDEERADFRIHNTAGADKVCAGVKNLAVGEGR